VPQVVEAERLWQSGALDADLERPVEVAPTHGGPDLGGEYEATILRVAYVLCRIEDDSSLTPVSQHRDFLTGMAAAGYAVEVEDFDFAHALYAGDPSNGSATRVASFREGRIGYRLWATRRGRISPSVEDRLDHDVDELMA
jgi:hypothetical protein